jgi:phosphatidylserine decarboxylase
LPSLKNEPQKNSLYFRGIPNIMTIHREGYPTIAVTFIFLSLVNFIVWKWLGQSCPVCFYALAIASLGLFLFIVSFFRIPARKAVMGDNLITSPCDGKVVAIETINDTEFYKDARIQVSVFMSPANVHVNTCPISGDVVYSTYHPGKYLVAWHPKSSTENERHSVVIRNERISILVKQIAGALARRIVNYLQPGHQAEQGKELGFIKFGSRVDLLLPPGTEICVELNEKVKAGVTVIAKY